MAKTTSVLFRVSGNHSSEREIRPCSRRCALSLNRRVDASAEEEWQAKVKIVRAFSTEIVKGSSSRVEEVLRAGDIETDRSRRSDGRAIGGAAYERG